MEKSQNRLETLTVFSYDYRQERGAIPVKDKNICKFIPSLAVEILYVSCFVLEANPEIMQRDVLLKTQYMFLVCQGSALFRLGDSEVPVSTGSLVFGFKGERFSVKNIADCNYMYICFEGTRSAELFRRFDIRKERRAFENFSGMIGLTPISGMRLSVDEVHYKLDVTRYLEVKRKDVPVKVQGAPAGTEVSVQPQTVDVLLYVEFPLKSDPKKDLTLEARYDDAKASLSGQVKVLPSSLPQGVIRYDISPVAVKLVEEQK